MSPVIFSINEPEFREKIVGLDYDWTLVNPKQGKTFPKDIDDWEWFSPNVPEKLKKYYDDGFMLVIFTNQSKKWKYEQIKQVIETLNIPMFVVIANIKSEYKPNTILFDELFKNKEINKSKSFFIGDALGRKSDFSDSDKVFADNIGIPYFPPEKIFVTGHFSSQKYDISQISLSNTSEIIIMMGYPGSGKTTLSEEIIKTNNNYVAIKGDDYKSNTSKMLKASLEHIKNNKSIIYDATNSSIKKRKLYIDFANKYNYSVKCIHISTSLDKAYKQNLTRQDEKKVPKIAFSVYKKYYEEPNEKEGFKLLSI